MKIERIVSVRTSDIHVKDISFFSYFRKQHTLYLHIHYTFLLGFGFESKGSVWKGMAIWINYVLGFECELSIQDSRLNVSMGIPYTSNKPPDSDLNADENDVWINIGLLLASWQTSHQFDSFPTSSSCSCPVLV